MDSSQNDISIVEDDMGEGYKDPIEQEETLKDKQQREMWQQHERLQNQNRAPIQ